MTGETRRDGAFFSFLFFSFFLFSFVPPYTPFLGVLVVHGRMAGGLHGGFVCTLTTHREAPWPPSLLLLPLSLAGSDRVKRPRERSFGWGFFLFRFVCI